MSLGKRLKAERERRNWSQKYVADKVGITNTVLSNYERDYRDPDTETLKRLADLYEVETDYLLGRTDSTQLNKKSEPINSAFYQFEKLTDEEKEYLDMQLELFRDMKKKKNK